MLRHGRGNRRGLEEAKGIYTNSHRYPSFVAVTLLSGICADKITQPEKDYIELINTGGSSDWTKARISIRSHFVVMHAREAKAQGKHHTDAIDFTNKDADSELARWLHQVQQFVISEWAAISRIGEALLASPTNMLTYAECKALS